MIVILALHDANSAAPVDEFSDGLAALGDALNGVGAPCTLLRGSAQELLAAWEGIDTAARLLIDLRLIGDFAAYAQELIARGAAAIVLHRQALGPDDPALSEAARALLARLPHILVPSLIVADALVDRYEIPRAQVHLLSPGIADFAVAQREMEDGCAILTIGALVPESGHDLLLRALDRLFDLDWTLTIVGASVGKMAHEEELRALAQEGHCAGRVRFVDGRDSDRGGLARGGYFRAYRTLVRERRGNARGAAPRCAGRAVRRRRGRGGGLSGLRRDCRARRRCALFKGAAQDDL